VGKTFFFLFAAANISRDIYSRTFFQQKEENKKHGGK